MYLAGLSELAIYSFVKGAFAMTRPPQVPGFLVAWNPWLAYVGGAILLLGVMQIVSNRFTTAAVAGFVVVIFVGTTVPHVFGLWKDPINGFKSLWLIGGALLMLMPAFDARRRSQVLYYNIIVLFVFFYLCGVAHFQFPDFVKTLIPGFIPFPLFWTYLAGVCLLAGGIGLLVDRTRRLAALLSGIQIAGWFILLHIPRALTLGGDEWIGVGESLAVAGIAFMVVSPPTEAVSL